MHLLMRVDVRATFRAIVVAVCGLVGLAAMAQTFAAPAGAEAAALTSMPGTGERRVMAPGHRRDAENKLIYARIRDGVYSVDGMVAKVQLNYDVDGANFLYLFVPGVGTAVVSAAPAADAVMARATVRDGELRFRAGEHQFALTGIAVADGWARARVGAAGPCGVATGGGAYGGVWGCGAVSVPMAGNGGGNGHAHGRGGRGAGGAREFVAEGESVYAGRGR